MATVQSFPHGSPNPRFGGDCSLWAIRLFMTLAVWLSFTQAAHLNRHIMRGSGAMHEHATTLQARQQTQLTSDIQALQQQLAQFSQSLNQWLAEFLSDLEHETSGSSVTPLVSSQLPSSSVSLASSSFAGYSSPTEAPSTPSDASSSPIAFSSASRTASAPTTSTSAPNSKGGGSLAVYFGQAQNATTGLLPLCSDPSIDIINLAFLNEFFSSGGYPSINMGSACWPPTPGSPAAEAGAQGLLNCTNIGSQIQTCQEKYHTKFLLSLGGYIAQSSFPNATAARQLADTVWNLFGAGTALPSGLRPFGPGVIVDGFDIDNEDHNTQYWTDFARQLKSHYTAAQNKSGRKFYLSAAPQCPRPDASIPEAVMQMADYVWVQFYNNPDCNLNAGSGFLDSVEAWSRNLAGNGTSKSGPRLFIGAGAFPGAGSGYVSPEQLGQVVQQAEECVRQSGDNFGGMMLWDGTVGVGNGYVQAAAEALS